MKRSIIVLILSIFMVSAAFAAHDHVHHAPHGGALVVLGEEEAHLEFVLDKETGRLTAYILDAHAQESVRLNTSGLMLKITLEDKTVLDVSLTPVANLLTGETADNTSEFAAVVDGLKGVGHFEGIIEQIAVKASVFKAVAFSYPEGNEHDEGHSKEHHRH